MNNQEQENKPAGSAKDNSADTSAIYFGDSRMQTKEEFEQNKKRDHSKEDNTVTSSHVEDTQSDVENAEGTERAGTAERKNFGDIELNKGLESQAKDEEA